MLNFRTSLIIILAMPLLFFAGFLASNAEVATGTSDFPVKIVVDAGRIREPISQAWSYFGADEPNFATMKDGETLLNSLGELNPGHVYFRTHHLFTSGDGTAALKWGSTNIYTEDLQGNPVYDYTIIDHIFDTYLQHGVRPYVELGFMPEALSSHPSPYRSDWRPGLDYGRVGRGVSYPPKDYAKWGDLVYNWVLHCVQRYGAPEVSTWYFETWNEANFDVYWKGTPEEFYRLHNVAVAAVRRALPTAKVGGPDMADSKSPYLDKFLAQLTAGKTPTDFISFHAKGTPSYGTDHVVMNMSPQLMTAEHGFEVIAANKELKAKPIIIGESDPDGCAACLGSQFGYRNSTMYSSYTAASFPRLVDLARKNGVNLEGVLTWSFEFEDQPYFAGYRQLMSNGIDLPILNVFRMFAQMQGRSVDARSTSELTVDEIIKNGVRSKPDVGVRASLSDDTLTVIVWHYFDENVSGVPAQIDLNLANLPEAYLHGAEVTEFLIDATHSNSYSAWQKLGSPTTLNENQFEIVSSAGKLQTTGPTVHVATVSRAARLNFELERQAVALFVIKPTRSPN